MQHLALGSSAALKMRSIQSSAVLSNMLTNACVHWYDNEEWLTFVIAKKSVLVCPHQLDDKLGLPEKMSC